MPTLNYSFKFKKNTGLLISASEMRDDYLFGVIIKDADGRELGDEVFEKYIRAASDFMERFLDIKLEKQIADESFHFNHTDWQQWAYLKTTYPVSCAFELTGFLNTIKQVEYPREWLQIRRTNNLANGYHRRITVVPAGNSAQATFQVIFSGIAPQLGYMNMRIIPDYWSVVYSTGFDQVPFELLDAVGKMASLGMFNIAGDLILGAGIANFSLGLDGLSQSIGTTSSATNAGYGARITTYKDELKKRLPELKDFYKGLVFTVA